MILRLYLSIGFFAALVAGVALEFPSPILIILGLAQIGFYINVAAAGLFTTLEIEEDDTDD